MLTSATRLPALALPFIVALSGNPAPAQMPQRTPGQAVVMTGAAATVISTAHYQAELSSTCGSNFCAGDFPPPGAKRRLNLTRITCWLDSGTDGSTFRIGYIELRAADNARLLTEFLPVDYSASTGDHTLNHAVDVQVAAKQHIHVDLELATGAASGFICSATGTLDTLQ